MTAQHSITGSSGITARVSTFGARLVELMVPDRLGRLSNVVLGFDTPEDYREHVDLYFGATVGPIAGRVADGRFLGGGLRLDLEPNEGTTHLHGGPSTGFDRVEWEVAEIAADAIELRLLRPDGEGGYPGELDVRAGYRLIDSELHLSFTATASRATPVSLVNHTYVNLSGDALHSIVDHSLLIAASNVLATDERLLPTGGTRPVAGTPLDYRAERRIGDLLPQGGEPWPGVDNTFVLDPDAPTAASLYDPLSGRTLEITTSEPTLQVYTGNRIPRLAGRSGSRLQPGSGICLEAQRVPDSPRLPDRPTIVVAAGDTYRQTTVWRFGIR